ncbi:MAG: hypothetical protein OCD02_20105 [Spirochaetaceae bacterium]
MELNYKEYKTLDGKVDKLYEEKRYEEAAKLLEDSYDLLPGFYMELNVYALYCYIEGKYYVKCLELLKKGTDDGHFYGLTWDKWDPLRSYPEWPEIEKKNSENKNLALKTAKMEYKVFTPQGYDQNKKYPLFCIQHGDGGNLEQFSYEWKPDFLLKNNFIVAYIQSSNPVATSFFTWTADYEKSRNDISICYDILCSKYPIDRSKVILGGFSGGSMASLSVAMNDLFPVQGIMALCPNKVPDCTEENIQKAAERGLKLVLLEGELSGAVPFHAELLELTKKHNLPSVYVINKNASHNVPENWDDVVKDAVEFIQG